MTHARCLALGLVLATAAVAQAGSATPPPGAHWEHDLLVAQRRALEQGKPLFLYFTKTY
jgi:hypothetical protein